MQCGVNATDSLHTQTTAKTYAVSSPGARVRINQKKSDQQESTQ
jgi:hypothetical protein